MCESAFMKKFCSFYTSNMTQTFNIVSLTHTILNEYSIVKTVLLQQIIWHERIRYVCI